MWCNNGLTYRRIGAGLYITSEKEFVGKIPPVKHFDRQGNLIQPLPTLPVYLISDKEYIGRIPIRTPLTVLSADRPWNRTVNFRCFEFIGLSDVFGKTHLHTKFLDDQLTTCIKHDLGFDIDRYLTYARDTVFVDGQEMTKLECREWLLDYVDNFKNRKAE